jgi:hypothetical protein
MSASFGHHAAVHVTMQGPTITSFPCPGTLARPQHCRRPLPLAVNDKSETMSKDGMSQNGRSFWFSMRQRWYRSSQGNDQPTTLAKERHTSIPMPPGTRRPQMHLAPPTTKLEPRSRALVRNVWRSPGFRRHSSRTYPRAAPRCAILPTLSIQSRRKSSYPINITPLRTRGE